jgi:hypothetical protein
MVMKPDTPCKREFRVIAAGVFKATCLQLLDEVYENRNLSIIVTKRGKPIGQLIAPPDGLKLIGPTVQVETYNGDTLSDIKAHTKAAFEEDRKKKKEKKKKHK